ncbi:MAG: hypothetical protein M1368_08515 [Thaumarchaeota archaeon]|nr:hypothetical protein [Nitrososphaerota archaeon]
MSAPQLPLLSGEQVVWSHEIMQGVIHRHPAKILAVTNSRALIYDVITNSMASVTWGA